MQALATHPTNEPEIPSSIWARRPRHRLYPVARPNHGSPLDVVVVGAGICGLTTAHLLARRGVRVAVLEADAIASGQTAQSTSEVTWVVDQPLPALIKDFGLDRARCILDALARALDEIELVAREADIDCHLARVPGYRFGVHAADAGKLRAEVDAAAKLGRRARYATSAEVPIHAPGGALLAPDQIQLDPVSLCDGLARCIVREGSDVFEGSRVTAVHHVDGGWNVEAAGAIVRARHLVVASGSPFGHVPSLQARIEPVQTYAHALRIEAGSLPAGLYWDTDVPYHHVRTLRSGDDELAVVGGCDHRTGEASDTFAHYGELRRWALECLHLASSNPVAAWSGQVLESVDGIPYIGAMPGSPPNHWVATGFGGSGIAYGVVAARLLSNLILGVDDNSAEVFDPGRKSWVASATRLMRHNAETAWHRMRGRLARGEAAQLAEIARGEGRIARVGGRRLAVYRDPAGGLTLLSPVCPHMGCIVAWNASESTWDCPCHGSRFAAWGQVQTGPATEPLTHVAMAADDKNVVDDERVDEDPPTTRDAASLRIESAG